MVERDGFFLCISSTLIESPDGSGPFWEANWVEDHDDPACSVFDTYSLAARAAEFTQGTVRVRGVGSSIH